MRWLIVLLLMLVPGVVEAQASGGTGRTAFGRSQGTFFALSVADLVASTTWYEEKLGLQVVLRSSPTDRSKVAVLEGGGLMVELVEESGATRRASATNPAAVHGFFKAGLVVEDLQATLSVLRTRGVEVAYGPYPATPTQRSNAIIRDNSGNLIQLFGR